jgi:hypothetical protein
VVREFCGHGIGRNFHEEPQVLHYGKPGTLEELVPGMTFTIEPMINAGRRDVKEFGNDGWTIVTKDHSLSAQWEHTVLVTESGYDVLTLSAGSPPAAAGLRVGKSLAAAVLPADAASPVAGIRGRSGRARPTCWPTLQATAARPASIRGAACRSSPARPTRRCGSSGSTPVLARRVALVATGGFWSAANCSPTRRDVLLLMPDASPASWTSRSSSGWTLDRQRWGRPAWRSGSSVRTLENAWRRRAGDVTVQPRLLEARLLTGSASCSPASRRAFAPDRRARLLHAKTLEMRQRHTKFENTPYSLEPNCKESPAGLRDLQVILWVANAAGFGRSWDELARRGLATASRRGRSSATRRCCR